MATLFGFRLPRFYCITANGKLYGVVADYVRLTFKIAPKYGRKIKLKMRTKPAMHYTKC